MKRFLKIDSGRLIANRLPVQLELPLPVPDLTKGWARYFLKWLPLFLLPGLLIGLIAVLMPLGAKFPINKIQVFGELSHVDQDKLTVKLEKYLHANYFNVQMQDIQNTLEGFVWIEDVRIRRAWPDTLFIHVKERAAIAKWHDGRLLSKKEVLFDGEGVDADRPLPLFTGSESDLGLMLATYYELADLFKRADLHIGTLLLEERLSWEIRLDTGLIILVGNTNAIDKVAGFIALYEKLPEQDRQEIERADLRYENGIAIKRKKNHGKPDSA
jgi:cell division protein FtsQ